MQQSKSLERYLYTYPTWIMRTRYGTVIHMAIHIIGQPILKKLMKLIGYPASAAIPAITTFALAPMSVPIPPMSAPKHSAHARG